MTFLGVRYLAEENGDPIPPLDDALFEAAKTGDEATLRARLAAGVPPDHPFGDNDRMTPLMYAVYGGFHGCMRLLLEAGADVHLMEGKDGGVPLRVAIQKQDREAVKMLLAFDADPGFKCVRARPDHTAYGEAVTDVWLAQQGDPEIAAMVTEAYKKFRVVEMAHEEAPDLAEMRRLLEEGAPVNIKNDNGQTALMYACIRRNVETVRLLLEFSADTEISWQGTTALRLACGGHYGPPSMEIVQLLLAHGADMHKLDERGRGMLHAAVADGDEEIVKLFTRNGLSLTARDAKGMTLADAANEWNSEGEKAAQLVEKVAAWNIEEIGRQATRLDRPVKAMKPIRLGKG
ncbi:MAG: ankyrin repeat domain-containing protein [Alphaproteobacteria bacterium]|nr:MAG: ankyrin repeat domain-containing protein [Alphaproteobacteria bacterium]